MPQVALSPSGPGPAPGPGAGAGPRWSRGWLLAALLLALLPSWGTWSAPWIAEDAALLEQAAHASPFADWTRSQGGLSIVRFWRPLVSLSWSVQEHWTGVHPLPLRVANLLAHLGCVALVGLLVRRLGGGRGAAFLAAAWVATFPDQGGTVTWLAGRTDLLVGAALLGGLWLALGRRPWSSAPLAVLAGATKEFGFLLPLWVLLLAWGRGERGRALSRTVLPSALGAALALGLRRLALGTWVGGYPAGASTAPLGLGLAASALARAWIPTWPVLVGVVAWCAPWRRAARPALPFRRRLPVAALAATLAALGLLFPLLRDGWLEPQNARLLFVPELGLALFLGACAVRAEGTRAFGILVLVVLAPRLVSAWRDTHEWAASARLGEQRVAAARALVAGVPATSLPVLVPGLARIEGGAYCLGFGLPSRFRPPFPEPARPIWPLRPLFFDADTRPPAVALRADGSLWPEDLERARGLSLRRADGTRLVQVELDASVFAAPEDRSGRFTLSGGPPAAALEAVLYTDMGYEAFPLGELNAIGGAAGSWQQVVAAGNGHTTVGETLLFVADLGARSAGLEFRALGAGREPLVSSGWVEIRWPEELVRRALSER